MGNLYEEKALEGDNQCLINSLEEDVLSFFGENSDEFNQFFNDDDESDSGESLSDRSKFWEKQEQILQELLSQSSSTGKKLRREINEAMKTTRETCLCICHKYSMDRRCSTCLRRVVVDRLCDGKYNAALCTSKWTSTRKIPGGTHEYIDVITRGPSRKKETRYLIELEFRAEFKMAKPCKEYQNLINQLPESYVGKPEHLSSILHVISSAAKRSMKEKNIPMGPWRKRSFMQMKWLGTCYQRWCTDKSTMPEPVQYLPVHRCYSGFSAPAAVGVA